MKPHRKITLPLKSIFARAGIVSGVLSALFLACASLQAANYTMTVQQGFGSDWNITPPWSSGLSATNTIVADSAATFEILAGARMRTPDAALVAIFPGNFTNSLKITGNSVYSGTALTGSGEIRFKQANGTDNGIVTFANLILNGGQLDSGNDMTAIVQGQITVNANTTNYFYGDSTGNDRGARLDSYLTGSGTLAFNGGKTLATATVAGTGNRDWNITGTTNTFTGKLIVTQGLLIGSGTNSLGTNSITIQTAGGLETLYDYLSTNGSLTINGNGKFYLHQSNTFLTVIIGGKALGQGVYTFTQLNTTYSNNFPATWSSLNGTGYLGAEAYQAGSGYLNVLSGNTAPVSFNPKPANARVLLGQTARFAPVLAGPADTIQWYSNNVAISGATNLVYTTSPTTLANNNDVYTIAVTNNINGTNASATLTLGTLVYSPGFLKKETYLGFQYATTNVDGSTNSPDTTTYVTSLETGTQGSGYVERISGFFIPQVTTNYTFFEASDDDSVLLLSTDSTSNNAVAITRETVWSNARQWYTSAGFSDTSLKRSDSFTPDGGITYPFTSGISMVAGQQYFIEGIHHQNGGGDNFSATFKFITDPDPLAGSAPLINSGVIACYAIDGNTLSITNPPQSKTITNGQFNIFTVGFQSSTTNVVYQWQRANTNIPNANSSSYTTPAMVVADSGSQYRVIVGIPGLAPVTSAAATLTVVPDVNAPTVIETPGTLQNTNGVTEISVIYNKIVTASAINPANYHLNSGSVTNVRWVTNCSGVDFNRSGVVLTTAGLNTGTTYTLSISGIIDTFGNALVAVNFPVKTSKFNWVPLGNTDTYGGNGQPVLPSDALAVGTNGFNLVNAGEFFANDEDDITFIYEQKTNDFDVFAQIQHVDPSGFLSSVGLMMRETVEAPGPTAGIASRFQSTSVTPITDYLGNAAGNRVELWQRLSTGGLVQDPFGTFVNSLPSVYPNIWVRLKRVGNTILSYIGVDGVNWNFYRSQTFSPDLPSVVYVGPFLGSWVDQIGAVNAQEFEARVRSYSDLYVAPASFQLQSVAYSSGSGQVSFGIPTQSGYNYTVQYKTNLLDPVWLTLQVVPGNGGVVTINDTTTGANTRFYRVNAQ